MGQQGQANASYFVDSLFRKDASAMPAASTAPMAQGTAGTTSMSDTQGPVPTAEVGRIFASGMRTDAALPPEDTRYVGQLVAQRTGMAQADAEKRVTEAYAKLQAQVRDAETKAREAADKARKASAYAALWMFVSLLVGAFVASFSATLGGRQRDF